MPNGVVATQGTDAVARVQKMEGAARPGKHGVVAAQAPNGTLAASQGADAVAREPQWKHGGLAALGLNGTLAASQGTGRVLAWDSAWYLRPLRFHLKYREL